MDSWGTRISEFLFFWESRTKIEDYWEDSIGWFCAAQGVGRRIRI